MIKLWRNSSLGINLNEFIEAPTYEAATFTPERTKEAHLKQVQKKTSERDDDDFQNSPSSKSKEDALPVVDVIK